MTTEPKSLREHILESIGNFLYRESFPTSPIIPQGLLSLLDSIGHYMEEGSRLYPEILLTTSLELTTRSLQPKRTIEIQTLPITVENFTHALKISAPLAKDGWIIFIETSTTNIRFGLISIESSEFSPSLYNHLVGNLAQEECGAPFAYIRSPAEQIVHLKGTRSEIFVSLSLKENTRTISDELPALSKYISKDVGAEIQEFSMTYFNKLLEGVVKQPHGNLIAVVEDNRSKIEKAKRRFPDGIYLPSPLDMVDFLKQSEQLRSREASTFLRTYGTLVQGMLSLDGVTLFSTKGRVLGYHIFVKEKKTSTSIEGGARSRAFKILHESGLFSCCFYKSQDGNMKIWGI